MGTTEVTVSQNDLQEISSLQLTGKIHRTTSQCKVTFLIVEDITRMLYIAHKK